MSVLQIKSASEQVADYLREQLIRGTWSTTMPGESHLLKLLGAGRDTIKAALAQLEQEGVLVNQGQGRRRLIAPPDKLQTPSLKIAIINYDSLLVDVDFLMRDLLAKAHHTVKVAPKTLVELNMSLKRVARLVKATSADAWIITSGSRQVLEWFLQMDIPAFSLHGYQHGLPIAGTGVSHAECVRSTTRKLVGLGHHRIVMLSRRGRKEGSPGIVEQAFLNQMETLGLPVGLYNLPAWEDSPEGFRACLDSLFRHTPPSAMFIEEPPHFWAAVQFLGNRGLKIPQDVSLICSEAARSFSLSSPPICHMHWKVEPIVRRIIRWADNIAHGKKDIRQTRIKVEFADGGTIGPAPGSGN